MEKLNLEKFEPLSTEDLSQLKGGWGWEVVEAQEYHYLGKDRTHVLLRRNRLFGDDDYRVDNDTC
jgi:hypothetical protein